MNHLKDQLSRGSCESIYREAAAAFRAQTSENWLGDCTQIEDELGAWKDFQIEYDEGIGDRDLIVLVFGPAVFEKGSLQVEANFMLNSKGARLSMLGFRKENRDWLMAPPRPNSRPDRLIDPPLKSSSYGRSWS
jgi:hypothetical protein